MSRIKVGMGQMAVLGGQPEVNLARARAMIGEAAALGCDVVVLPECLDLGWTHPSARELAEPIPGPRSEALCHAARQHVIHVIAGLTELEGIKIYNAAVMIDAAGNLVSKHRKISILNIASDLYAPGKSLQVVDAPWGPTGMLICADNFPESLCLGHSLARMGARYIFSPCAWAVPSEYDNTAQPYGELWRDAYGTLAAEHNLAVVGVSNVGRLEAGPWTGYQCIGCSLAVGPDGEERMQAPYGVDADGLWVVEL